MPYTKRYKKKKTKSKPKRKQSYAISRQPQVVSNGQVVTLRYSDHVLLDASTVKAYDTWSATSCFDPYVAAGGHQPLGFDEWSVFYNHYTVLGAKCTATAEVWQTTANSGVALVGKLSGTSAWAPTDLTTLIEQNKSKVKYLSGGTGSRSVGSIVLYYSPRKFFSLKNPRDEHDLRGITGNSGSNPAENAYFHVGVAGMNPSDDPPATKLRVLIEYRVLFTERKDLTGS